MRFAIRAISLTTALFAATIGYAEGVGDKGQGYLSPGIVIYEGPDASNIGYDDHEAGPGLILGYNMTERWAIEFLVARTESEFSNYGGQGEDDIDLRWLDFAYKLNGGEDWQPFVLFGGGRSKYSFENLRDDAVDHQFNVGLGVLGALGERFAVRADLRAVSTAKGGAPTAMAFVGLTGFIGPAAAPPPPPPDSDGDGVPNDADKCPTTPAGRVVDADGCELDGDGDGVVDGDDRCPNTPAGAKVDSRGCALDGDGDGVPDYRDDCPDTSKGAKVDERGCYIELEEEVTIDMNLEFDVDKAEIKPEHHQELFRVVKFLTEYATAEAVIEGHTDSTGSAAYNQKLSERRAKAVYDYLIQSARISADRLSWAGFGEGQPKASNDTREGRQQNRRVSAVVRGTQTVRQ